MSDHHAGYIVTLEKDLRDEDSEVLISAIKCLKNVVSVSPIVSNFETQFAEEKARDELARKLWNVLYPRK